MIIMGGTLPVSDVCDAPKAPGMHGLDLGNQDPQGVVWQTFRQNLTSYVVPPEILAMVGGEQDA